jgi:MoxR-like ATPase
VPYPSEAEELEILNQFHRMGNTDAMSAIQSVLHGDTIVRIRKTVKEIVIDHRLLSFIAKLVHQTRHNKSIYLGGSPRASLAIMNASKAMAAINGRDFVTPDDILEITPSVLRHRIILSPDKEMEGVTEDNVIKQIIQTLDIPR